MGKGMDKLTPELVELLNGEVLVSLVTIDKDSKEADLGVISWVKASSDGTKVKFALGHKARSAENIQAEPSVTLGLIGAGSCYAVKGKGTVSDIKDGTMKYRIVTVDVESVDDVIFYGGKITTEPAYEKTYDADLAKKLDDEVYELLKD
ncbi:hypothetical protein J2S74_004443 [Evansella vedderi]|uniref:Pyridoxamine 5'-phosphate oxidase n=1 Tax=Evansella vedderi TaxID=38282 RepID=A0ABU0A0H7_9BACI|nr:pyridoxamine 5'-phosphate oxidase [Evansella vedderi]MDQ0256998.1 hypothetical protein [Evansella vedderi]